MPGNQKHTEYRQEPGIRNMQMQKSEQRKAVTWKNVRERASQAQREPECGEEGNRISPA